MNIQKERAAFEAFHNEKIFKIVKFDSEFNSYILHDHLGLTSINLTALAEINYGWDLWLHLKADAVPEGFVLVPKEPTKAMIEAAEGK